MQSLANGLLKCHFFFFFFFFLLLNYSLKGKETPLQASRKLPSALGNLLSAFCAFYGRKRVRATHTLPLGTFARQKPFALPAASPHLESLRNPNGQPIQI